MVKVGDKLQWLGGNGEYWETKGIYEVKQVIQTDNPNRDFILRITCRGDVPIKFAEYYFEGPTINTRVHPWKIIKKVLDPPKTEVEWLNRVQENFRE